MANALKHEKQEQIQSLGRLGWSLRRIGEATGVRLGPETANCGRAATGIGLRSPSMPNEQVLSVGQRERLHASHVCRLGVDLES